MSLTVLSNETGAESTGDSPAKDPTEEAIGAFYKVAKACADLLGGPDQAAIRMKVDRSDLTRALNRNGRYLTADHIIRLGTVLRDGYPETAQRLGAALVGPMDLLVMTRTQMSAAEMKCRVMAYLRQLPYGPQMIADAFSSVDPCVQITPAEALRLLRAEVDKNPPEIAAMIWRKALETPVPAGAM